MSDLDRSIPPKAGEWRPFDFPSFERRRLRNGLDVVCAPTKRFPLLSLDLLLPAGGYHAGPGEAGLPSLHGDLLDEGTHKKTAIEIANEVERIGGYLGSGSDWNVASVGVNLLSQQVDTGLALIADIARNPAFPDDEVERLRRQRLTEILRRRSQPGSLAQMTFARTVFQGTTFEAPLIGTEDSLEQLNRDDCVAFYKRRMGPAGAVMIAVGDFDPDALVPKIDAAFGDWEKQLDTSEPTISPEPLTSVEVHVVDRPNAAQTQLQLGHLGISRNSPDHPRVLLMNAIFGGIFTSRINLNLRERHGFTYGATSQLVYRRGPGVLAMRAAVATESAGTAVQEVLHEMRRMREEPVSEDELRDCQDFLVGVFPTTLQTIGDIARRLEDLVVYDLGEKYYESYPDVLRHVSQDDIQDAAQRYLHPDRLAIVAVGPADDLLPQLAELGEVRVHTP